MNESSPLSSFPFLKRQRYRLEYAALAGFAWIAPKLPRACLLLLAHFAGWAAWHLDRRGHHAALDNFAVIFPDWSNQKRRRSACQSYQMMAQTFFDLFWAAGRKPDEIAALVDIDPEVYAQIPQWGKEGGIWLTPHYGNFEWLSWYFAYRHANCHIITQNFKNPLLTGLFARLRRHGDHSTLPQEGAALKLMRLLKRGANVAFLPDLKIDHDAMAVPLRSFGRILPVTPLHAILAQRTGRPALLWTFRPLPKGRYRMDFLGKYFVPRDESPAQAVQNMWDIIEAKIREHPEYYLWMYKHWRNDPGETGVVYPAYAGSAPRFNQWLQQVRKTELARVRRGSKDDAPKVI